MPTVLVPPARWTRWQGNFEGSHGTTEYRVDDGTLVGRAEDGSWLRARLPFDVGLAGPLDPPDLATLAGDAVPSAWGVLLVRKGGFATARLDGARILASKVGQRHVQGRTKAGGQSQQRFARRRGNQARQAYEAAADHAARLLGELTGRSPLVVGGDRAAVAEVLADPRMSNLDVVGPWLAVPDPRRAVLEQAVADAQSLQVEVHNADDDVQ